jgi:hypothetical protein
VSPADEAAGEGEEALVDLVAAVGADEKPAAVVEPGEGALDDPALLAESGAVFGLAAGDDRFDPALPDQAAVLVVVVTAVGQQRARSVPGSAGAAADSRHAVEQRFQLGDVVAVAAGERPGQRDAAAVYEEVVLAAPAAAIDRAGTGFCAPFFACR